MTCGCLQKGDFILSFVGKGVNKTAWKIDNSDEFSDVLILTFQEKYATAAIIREAKCANLLKSFGIARNWRAIGIFRDPESGEFQLYAIVDRVKTCVQLSRKQSHNLEEKILSDVWLQILICAAKHIILSNMMMVADYDIKTDALGSLSVEGKKVLSTFDHSNVVDLRVENGRFVFNLHLQIREKQLTQYHPGLYLNDSLPLNATLFSFNLFLVLSLREKMELFGDGVDVLSLLVLSGYKFPTATARQCFDTIMRIIAITSHLHFPMILFYSLVSLLLLELKKGGRITGTSFEPMKLKSFQAEIQKLHKAHGSKEMKKFYLNAEATSLFKRHSISVNFLREELQYHHATLQPLFEADNLQKVLQVMKEIPDLTRLAPESLLGVLHYFDCCSHTTKQLDRLRVFVPRWTKKKLETQFRFLIMAATIGVVLGESKDGVDLSNLDQLSAAVRLGFHPDEDSIQQLLLTSGWLGSRPPNLPSGDYHPTNNHDPPCNPATTCSHQDIRDGLNNIESWYDNGAVDQTEFDDMFDAEFFLGVHNMVAPYGRHAFEPAMHHSVTTEMKVHYEDITLYDFNGGTLAMMTTFTTPTIYPEGIRAVHIWDSCCKLISNVDNYKNCVDSCTGINGFCPVSPVFPNSTETAAWRNVNCVVEDTVQDAFAGAKTGTFQSNPGQNPFSKRTSVFDRGSVAGFSVGVGVTLVVFMAARKRRGFTEINSSASA